MKTVNNKLWKKLEKDNKPKSHFLPLLKILLLALAIVLTAGLLFSALHKRANAYDLAPTLSLSFSGDTIRAEFYQIEPRDQLDYEDAFLFLHTELGEALARDDHDYACELERQLDILKINFADDLDPEAFSQLFDGSSKWISAQTLLFVEDNAIMNYALDDPIEIITLSQIITQQIANVLDYEPDLLTFIIFDASLAIVYQSNLWTSDNYFEEAAKAIDRAEDDSGGGYYEITQEDYITETDGLNTLVYPKPELWEEEKTNENMYPDRHEEQYYYDENNEKQYSYENEAIRQDQEEAEERIRAD